MVIYLRIFNLFSSFCVRAGVCVCLMRNGRCTHIDSFNGFGYFGAGSVEKVIGSSCWYGVWMRCRGKGRTTILSHSLSFFLSFSISISLSLSLPLLILLCTVKYTLFLFCTKFLVHLWNVTWTLCKLWIWMRQKCIERKIFYVHVILFEMNESSIFLLGY